MRSAHAREESAEPNKRASSNRGSRSISRVRVARVRAQEWLACNTTSSTHTRLQWSNLRKFPHRVFVNNNNNICNVLESPEKKFRVHWGNNNNHSRTALRVNDCDFFTVAKYKRGKRTIDEGFRWTGLRADARQIRILRVCGKFTTHHCEEVLISYRAHKMRARVTNCDSRVKIQWKVAFGRDCYKLRFMDLDYELEEGKTENKEQSYFERAR